MAARLDSEILGKALTLLGHRLERQGAAHVNLVVCGGSALIALGLVSRATRDVDVVALLGRDGTLRNASPLPEPLTLAARQVAADLRLDETWLNSGPGDQFRTGFPEGFQERLHPQAYGERLTVSFIDRIDQIHFKLYAAADRGAGYHVDDLLALEPTDKELETAVGWTLTQDVSEGFRLILKDMLRALGHESVAEKI